MNLTNKNKPMNRRNANQNEDKNSREYQEQLLSRSRGYLLTVIIFTIINLVLLVLEQGTYFLFSAYIPYVVVDLGMALCGKYPAEYYGGELADMEFLNDTFFVITLVFAAVCLVLYLLSWILCKKPRIGWMIFALVFFCVDAIGMLLIAGISADMIVDIVFHGWVIVSLSGAVSASFKLKKLPAEEDVLEQLLEEQAELS